MKKVKILIPTVNRVGGLAVTLTSLAFQDYKDFDVFISDQNEEDDLEDSSIQTAVRLLQSKGHSVELVKHLPRRGLAEQRQFLLDNSTSPCSLFLDDDLLLESYVVGGMVRALEEEGCGFVGRAVVGLSFIDDVRPEEQAIEFWEGPVQPETILPGSAEWERYKLHNAANLLHVEQQLEINPLKPRTYKVAWVGGCVLFDTEKLRSVGGYTFWERLPADHAGEDVLAQLRVMQQFGGCGLIPSGVYHQELETTVKKRRVNAPELLFETSDQIDQEQVERG